MKNQLILAASRIYNTEGITPAERAAKVAAAAQELAAEGKITIEEITEYMDQHGNKHFGNVYGEPVWMVLHPNLTKIEVAGYNAPDDRTLDLPLGYLQHEFGGKVFKEVITAANTIKMIDEVENLDHLCETEKEFIIAALKSL